MGVEERRQQLIGVALELFSRRSPDEVSIDEIASAAGISRPLVYHYFPGKLSLYEAALRRAADDLAERFVEPRQGPLGARLLRVMRRFFDFVDDHGPGFSALMRGGPAVGSSTTNALIDSVRQAAYVQILSHLGVTDPPARLELVVRSWISLAESTALIWLDGRRVPRAELERQLVHDLAALLVVSAAYDEEMSALLRGVLAGEPADQVARSDQALVLELPVRGVQFADLGGGVQGEALGLGVLAEQVEDGLGEPGLGLLGAAREQPDGDVHDGVALGVRADGGVLGTAELRLARRRLRRRDVDHGAVQGLGEGRPVEAVRQLLGVVDGDLRHGCSCSTSGQEHPSRRVRQPARVKTATVRPGTVNVPSRYEDCFTTASDPAAWTGCSR
jgi:AcrR family transcriptional regulator